MQMRFHDVVVNETPKFQFLKPTELSHTISVIFDDVEEVLVTPLELNGDVSCLPIFKPSQEEFDTCDRYEYDPSAKKNVIKKLAWWIHGESWRFQGTYIPSGAKCTPSIRRRWKSRS
jgi:hypothetical protein